MGDAYDEYLKAGGVPVPPVELPASADYAKKLRGAGPQVPTEPDPGGWRTAGIAASTTLNPFAPKIFSAVHATTDKLKGGELPWREYYDAYLNAAERMKLGAQQNRPGTYMGVSMAAGVPAAALMPNTLAGQVGGFGALGVAQGLGESPHFLGRREESNDAQALGDAVRGGLWGAGAGAVGYGIAGGEGSYGGVPRQMLRSSDWLADKAVGNQTAKGARKLAQVKPKDMPPGEWADMLRDADIVGGWRSGQEVGEAAGEASADLGKTWGDIPKQADANHPGVRISDVETAMNSGGAGPYVSGAGIDDAALKYRNNFIDTLKTLSFAKSQGRSYDEVLERLKTDPLFRQRFDELKTPFMRVSHEDLQQALSLSKLQQEAGDAYGVAPNLRDIRQRWTVGLHQGVRSAQDAGLTEALGDGTGEQARNLRRTLALTKTIEDVSKDRATASGSHEFFGLPGWVMLGGGGPISAGLAASGHGLGAGLSAAGTAFGTGLARQYRNELYNLGTSATSKLGHGLDTDLGRLILRTPMEETMLQAPPVWRANQVSQDAPPKPEKKAQPVRKLRRSQPVPADQQPEDPEDVIDQLQGER